MSLASPQDFPVKSSRNRDIVSQPVSEHFSLRNDIQAYKFN